MTYRAILAAVLGFGLAVAPARAQEIKLPNTLTLTAHETGSNAFNQAVAVGQMLKNRHGTDLRVLTAGSDVDRLEPPRAGRAHLTSTGIGMYFAQEGVLEFAAKEWGPQPIQLLMASLTCNGQSLGAARRAALKGAGLEVGYDEAG